MLNKCFQLYLSIVLSFIVTCALAYQGADPGWIISSQKAILEADHTPGLDLSDDLTLDALIRIDSVQPEGTRIVDKYQSAGAGGFYLGFAEKNHFCMVFSEGRVISNIPVPLNRMVRLTGTFSKVSKAFKLYLDGHLISSVKQGEVNALAHTIYPIRVGADAEGGNRLAGLLKTIGIYNTALSTDEIVRLNDGNENQENTVPLIRWDFEDINKRVRSTGSIHLNLEFLRNIRGSAPRHIDNNTLWYKKPASQWTEALPIGNGRMGAMVYGGVERERLQLNDITVWSGGIQPDADRQNAYQYLDTVRAAIRSENYTLAQRLTGQHLTSSAPYDASYQTLGDLSLQFKIPDAEIQNYSRSLDIACAVSVVNFRCGGSNYTRESFSSAADGVLVEHLSSSKKGGLSFRLDLGRVERAKTRIVGNKIIMTGNMGGTLTYEVQALILNTGGKLHTEGNQIIVENADAADVLVSAGTSYILDYSKRFLGPDPHAGVDLRLKLAAGKSYQQLLQRHTGEFQHLFGRVKLDLGKARIQSPTDERLKEYGEGKEDPGFAALFYQFGRYLLISSSRSNNPLPSNSQGIWGDGLDLPWKCDYKSNINYEMNYWAAEEANMAEMHLPMIRMTQALKEPGIKTAKAYFGPETPGWYYGYTTNAWCWTSPGSGLPWGVFAGGSAWACQHLWDHYSFGRDKEYLRSVYPTMKGAAEFYLATMVKDNDGYLVTSPSTSPENDFITDGGVKGNITEGATMERSIIWELFDNVTEACSVLNIDSAFRRRVEEARDHIQKPQIGKAGQIMEWNKDWDMNSDDMGHRHVSHLFALYPGHQIAELATPDLAAAARKTLQLRGDDGTGWSIAWKENFWARLRDGNHAHKLISYQLRLTRETRTVMAHAGGTYPNLFDAHPPFQIDGNFGAVAGISEMLLQSGEKYQINPFNTGYILDLLPALPSAWPKGAVKGLRARGGFGLSMLWNNGDIVQATITSRAGGMCMIRAGKLFRIKGIAGQAIAKGGFYVFSFPTKKGNTYNLSVVR